MCANNRDLVGPIRDTIDFLRRVAVDLHRLAGKKLQGSTARSFVLLPINAAAMPISYRAKSWLAERGLT
jgi:hypothetical protein